MTTSPTGEVSYLNTGIRYTSLADVKQAMGVTDTTYDDQATQAIVAFETMIDVYLGQSFGSIPDQTTWTGPVGRTWMLNGTGAVLGSEVPVVVQQAALVGSMRIWKMLDSPGGTGGADSDGFIGLYEPQPEARMAFNSIRPMLVGLKTQWGVA